MIPRFEAPVGEFDIREVVLQVQSRYEVEAGDEIRSLDSAGTSIKAAHNSLIFYSRLTNETHAT